jgi:hypothetical protein
VDQINVIIVKGNELVGITDDQLFESLELFRDNLRFLVEHSIIVSMEEFTKVKKRVSILENELRRRNKTRLKVDKIGRFIVYSRK